jgi:hypothetical protein
MRRKTATTGLLVLGVVTVLAMLGFVYGSWAETFNVRGAVRTGDVNVNTELDVKNATLKGKQIARCEAEARQEVDKKTLIPVRVQNAYPGFHCEIKVRLINKSTVPIEVSGTVKSDSQAIDARIIDPDGKGNNCRALLNPSQKNPDRDEWCVIKVSVTKKAQQNTTYENAFHVNLLAELQNKPDHPQQ